MLILCVSPQALFLLVFSSLQHVDLCFPHFLLHCHHHPVYRCDGVVIRASALQSVDLGFISQVESYQKTLKNGIHSFPAQQNRDSVENKPSTRGGGARLTKDLQTEH